VPGARAAGQPFFGKQRPSLGRLPHRHAELGSVEAGLERNSGFREHGAHAAYVGRGEADVERLEARARGKVTADGAERKNEDAGGAERDQPLPPQTFEAAKKILELAPIHLNGPAGTVPWRR